MWSSYSVLRYRQTTRRTESCNNNNNKTQKSTRNMTHEKKRKTHITKQGDCMKLLTFVELVSIPHLPQSWQSVPDGQTPVPRLSSHWLSRANSHVFSHFPSGITYKCFHNDTTTTAITCGLQPFGEQDKCAPARITVSLSTGGGGREGRAKYRYTNALREDEISLPLQPVQSFIRLFSNTEYSNEHFLESKMTRKHVSKIKLEVWAPLGFVWPRPCLLEPTTHSVRRQVRPASKKCVRDKITLTILMTKNYSYIQQIERKWYQDKTTKYMPWARARLPYLATSSVPWWIKSVELIEAIRHHPRFFQAYKNIQMFLGVDSQTFTKIDQIQKERRRRGKIRPKKKPAMDTRGENTQN